MADSHSDELLHGDLSWASTVIYIAIVLFSILQLGGCGFKAVHELPIFQLHRASLKCYLCHLVFFLL